MHFIDYPLSTTRLRRTMYHRNTLYSLRNLDLATNLHQFQRKTLLYNRKHFPVILARIGRILKNINNIFLSSILVLLNAFVEF